MGVSSIDVVAARQVVAQLRALVSETDAQWRQVGRVCDEGLVETEALRGLGVPLRTIASLAGQLQERVELAELIEAAGVPSLGGVGADGRVSWQVGDDDSIADVRSQVAGLRLAADLGALEPGTSSPDRADVERLVSCADRLARYQDDPVAMAALFTALGARGTVRVPVMLHDLAVSYESGMGALAGQDLMWDQDTAMTARIASAQADLVEAFGRVWPPRPARRSWASPRGSGGPGGRGRPVGGHRVRVGSGAGPGARRLRRGLPGPGRCRAARGRAGTRCGGLG